MFPICHLLDASCCDILIPEVVDIVVMVMLCASLAANLNHMAVLNIAVAWA